MERFYIRKTISGGYNIVTKKRWEDLEIREHIIASSYLCDNVTQKILLSRREADGGLTEVKTGHEYPELEKVILERAGIIKLFKANNKLYVINNCVIIEPIEL